MRKKLVFIEEDFLNCKKFLQFFESYFTVNSYQNGLQGLISAIELKPDVVIINHSLLNVNSLELCRQIQQQLNTIIIIVGGPLNEEQIIKYYKAGANDVYLQQMSYSILLCKINVLLGLESSRRNDDEKVFQFGSLILNKENYKVLYENKELNFTRKEFSIIWLLVQKQGTVVSREDLIKGVWSYAHLDDDRMIDTHLNRIRKKLKQHHINLKIKTVWGIGYTLENEEKSEVIPLKKVVE